MKFLQPSHIAAIFLAQTVLVAQPVDYLNEIKPLLAKHCYECHGANQPKGGLRMDTFALMRAGGDLGTALIPGQSGESLLIQVVEGTHASVPRMPRRREALTGDEIELLKRWIDQGAVAPEREEEEQPGRLVSRHWAFFPPERPAPPEVKGLDWPRNPIDRFILAKLEREGVAPAPEADRVTLIRRLSLDLIGLPPSLGEVEAFVQDTRPDAYERLVERLLDSPHYGERWGRHWLDGARYADSNGYSIDSARSIWKYRDWVIDALNRDLPFDQFTIWQMAGDLLPGSTDEQKIATGFHRNTMVNEEGGIDREQFRVEAVLDRVNTTSTVFMGLTMACAQCHDHKYDPISQRDYFQLFAFFNNDDEPRLELLTEEEERERETIRAEIRRLERELRQSDDPENRERKAEIQRLRRSEPRGVTTLVLRQREQPRESHVFIQGDFTRKGEAVRPGTPEILPPLREGLENPTRLDLAEWLVSEENPLTARVQVNRIWQHYFGTGLVETENDFGLQGMEPTHPELLEWLAVEFREGWSLKGMHRLIVTSSTYRQSSPVRPELLERDPHNRWLARQNRLRLDAEVVRDVALASSGLLSDKIGGPGVFPPIPDGVMGLGQVRRAWNVSEGEDRYRRGMYTFFWRSNPHPGLLVFDAAESTSACTRRIRSNTPLQALTLLNDEAFFESAQALARRIAREGPEEISSRLDYAFRLCLARSPSRFEKERLLELYEQQLAEFREAPEEARAIVPGTAGNGTEELAAWTTVSRVLLNLDETITRE